MAALKRKRRIFAVVSKEQAMTWTPVSERLKKIRSAMSCPLLPEDAFDRLEIEEELLMDCELEPPKEER